MDLVAGGSFQMQAWSGECSSHLPLRYPCQKSLGFHCCLKLGKKCVPRWVSDLMAAKSWEVTACVGCGLHLCVNVWIFTVFSVLLSLPGVSWLAEVDLVDCA